MARVRLVFFDSEHELEIRAGDILLEAALRKGVSLSHWCRFGDCGKCKVFVETGAENLSAPTRAEAAKLGERIQRGYRLACQAQVLGPLTVKQ